MREVTQFFYRLRGYLADPRENGPELLVSIGLLLAVACIIIVFVLWIRFKFVNRKYKVIERARKAAEREQRVDVDVPKVVAEPDIPGAAPPQPHPLPWRPIALAAFIVLILWIAVASVPRYTMGKASYCGKCHSMKKAVKSWRASKHSKVPCQACHEGPGPGGVLSSQIQGLSNIGLSSFYWGRHRPIYLKTPVSPGCLSCHQDIRKKIVTLNDTIKISHREFVDSLGCESCHPSAGHAGKKLKRRLMDKCVACHVENKAGLACPTCHLAEPIWPKARLTKYAKARTTLRMSCLKCHESEIMCGRCHKAPESSPEAAQEDD